MTRPGGRPRPDHVVYVCTDPGVPVFGRKGCSVHVQAVLHQMVRRGAAVDLVTCRPGGDPPPALAGVRVHDLGRPGAADPAARERLLVEQDARAAALMAELVRGSRRGSRPLVYQRYALFGCEVQQAARRLAVPGVLEVNAPLVEEQAQHRSLVDAAGARRRTVAAMRAAGLCYAVSSPVARWAEDLLAGSRVVPVVPNGVDVERFTASTAPGRREGGPVTVAFVGTFRPWHGVDLLVEAAGRLRPSGGVRLLLVGDGPQHAAVLRRAAGLGVDVDAPGAVDPQQVPGLLARADVAAAPYPAGPAYFSPLKVMEYLAAGLATVAAGVGDLPALVRDGDEALLVPPGDVEALTEALRRLCDDELLRHRLGRAGRLAAQRRMTWEAVTDRVLDLSAGAQPAPAGAAGGTG